MPADVARMLEHYRPGEVVRAVRSIFDAPSGREVPEGTTGIVQDPRVRGVTALVSVSWDVEERGLPMTTSAENIEPAHRKPNRGKPDEEP